MSQPFSFGNATAMSHIDTPICQYLVCLYQKTKRSCQTQIYDKNIIFEVKSQGHTVVMSVRNTLYHCSTLTCQREYDYVKG